MMISYEAYVRGSMDNICTMVISLQDFSVCSGYIQIAMTTILFHRIIRFPIIDNS